MRNFRLKRKSSRGTKVEYGILCEAIGMESGIETGADRLLTAR